LGYSANFTSPKRWGFVFELSFSTSLTTGNPNNVLTSPLFGYSTQTLASTLGSGGERTSAASPSGPHRRRKPGKCGGLHSRWCSGLGRGWGIDPKEALQEQKVKLISELAMLYAELIKNVRKQSHKPV
jgi:hypothetical protein